MTLTKVLSHMEKRELPTSLPLVCTCATEWATHGNFAMQREKGRNLTQSYDKSTYTKRNVKRAKRQLNNATKKFDYIAVADRLRTVSWSNYSHPTGVVNLVYGQSRLPTTSIYGKSGQLNRHSTTSKYEKSGQLCDQRSGMPMGNLPCNLGCPLLTYIETVGSSVDSGVYCQWAVRGNLAKQMRLPTTLEMVGSSVGSPLLSSMETVGS